MPSKIAQQKPAAGSSLEEFVGIRTPFSYKTGVLNVSTRWVGEAGFDIDSDSIIGEAEAIIIRIAVADKYLNCMLIKPIRLSLKLRSFEARIRRFHTCNRGMTISKNNCKVAFKLV